MEAGKAERKEGGRVSERNLRPWAQAGFLRFSVVEG